MGVETRKVAVEEAGIRLDRWFRRHFPDLGHARLEKLLRTGQVRVEGRRVKASERLEPGQAVRIPPLAESTKPRPRRTLAPDPADLAAIQASTIYRDDQVLALNKPSGLPVQGGTGSERNLDVMLAGFAATLGGRPLLVHRLDRDTSGVLLLALNSNAAQRLAAAFRSRAAHKLYWALVAGAPPRRRGTIDLPLAKRMGPAGERVVAFDAEEGEDLEESGARRAITEFAVLDRASDKVAWLALSPRTGRTHQLRVHMAAVSTPILGDGKYGGAAAFVKMAGLERRVHLHARRLRIPHPSGNMLDLLAPAPPHFRAALDALGLASESADEFLDVV
jgi:23S rRNA pseudouridine955/2504/2580 synthase